MSAGASSCADGLAPTGADALAAYALSVENLEVAYRVGGAYRARRELTVLRELSFRIAHGETYGLVGESGCGKSTLALAVVRYLPPNGGLRKGRICIGERDLYGLGDEELRSLRATTLSMVYQDPARALNPSMRVGKQISEVFRLNGASDAEARARATAMLERVRIADALSVYQRYPHQISGGMQQRVAIAMALATHPQLLILDEPTTGLDATVEADILELVGELREELATAVLFISHNLAVIASTCERVGVLYAGALVEEGPTAQVFAHPRHPYTVGLLRCLPQPGRRKDHGRLDSIEGTAPAPDEQIHGCRFAPRCALAQARCTSVAPPLLDLGLRRARCHRHGEAHTLPRITPDEPPTQPAERIAAVDRSAPPLLKAVGVSKSFGTAQHRVRALHGVSLELWPGETLGLVGESGSGKTTLARLLTGLLAPDPGGLIELGGRALGADLSARRAQERRALQVVFQNPDSALNRSHSVRRIIGRVLARLARVPRLERPRRISELMRSVRLAERELDLTPAQLSGGMKQRVAIARAFAGDPRIVICDEPTSALDVSVQAAILNLLAELQAKRQVSYLLISHDLGAVRYLSDRVAVLYLGRLMEIGPAERVFSGPHHPYTAALLSAVPSLDVSAASRARRGSRMRLEGEMPSAIHVPRGCVFHTRCPLKLGSICEEREPPLHAGAEPGHAIRCHIRAADLVS